MNRSLKISRWMIPWVIISISFLLGSAVAAEWGKIMYPHARANIRAERDLFSPVKGKLEQGEPVKADFLLNNWYAVFRPAEEVRDEKRALGYVHAGLLAETRNQGKGRNSSGKRAPPSREMQDYASVSVKDIHFKIGRDGKETVSLELNRYYLPAILILPGDNPRIVIDVTNADQMKKEWSSIAVQGKLVKRIRSYLFKEGRMLRVVLDMEPKKNYFVNPVFSEGQNTYSLEVTEAGT